MKDWVITYYCRNVALKKEYMLVVNNAEYVFSLLHVLQDILLLHTIEDTFTLLSTQET